MRLLLVLLILSLGFRRGSQDSTDSEDESGEESVCSETPTLAETCGEDSSDYMGEVEEAVMEQDDLKDPTRCLYQNGSLKNEYDFIIVGGGTAGALVAGKLAACPGISVLLIEAGDSAPTAISVVSFGKNYEGNSTVNYNYAAKIQSNVCQQNEGICRIPSGKGVGGSGMTGNMQYLRGCPCYYNELAAFVQDDRWKYDNVLPDFMASEDNADAGVPGSPIENDIHGKKGPLDVSYFRDEPGIIKNFSIAFSQMGYLVDFDPNSRNCSEGFTKLQAITAEGSRGSTAKSFLFGQLNNSNIHIETNVKVLKIVVNSNSNTAYGVQLLKAGKKVLVRAKNEVVISSGVYETPGLLLASGIGDEIYLNANKIKPLVNLPGVGRNLKTIVGVSLTYYVNSDDNKNQLNNESLSMFLANRTGHLTSTGLGQYAGFLKSNDSLDCPDIFVTFAGYDASCSTTGDPDEREGPGPREFTITLYLLRPSSIGSVGLNTDPDNPLLIYGGFLEDPGDRKVLLSAIRKIEPLENTPEMKVLNVTMDRTPFPGCEDEEYDSEAYWDCFMTQSDLSILHASGTCRMGPENDPMAVTDSSLNVKGVGKLRIIDASVLNMPVGNNAPAIMVAEKAFNLIKNRYNLTNCT